MNLNRLTNDEMNQLAEAGLFTFQSNDAGMFWAEPNYRYLQDSIPIYDFDWGDLCFRPRSPLPEWTPNA